MSNVLTVSIYLELKIYLTTKKKNINKHKKNLKCI